MTDPTAGQLWLAHWKACEYADPNDLNYCGHTSMILCPMSPSEAFMCPTADAQLVRCIEKSLADEPAEVKP